MRRRVMVLGVCASLLFLAGVPMRDLGDARDEIVDAWSRHRF